MNETTQTGSNPAQATDRTAAQKGREHDALYQKGRVVARVSDELIDLKTKEICFGEVRNSDDLMIPEECEFREYRILIQKIAFATNIQRGEEHKGRVLRGVTCDLLGYLAS